MKKNYLLMCLVALLLSACVDHNSANLFYEEALKNHACDEAFFGEQRKKVDKNDDTIYIGINAGGLARNCNNFEQSNYFFDKAEEAYKYDVDLQGLATKGTKSVASAVLNESVLDYEGTLYERIMVNVYKGLNFMSLKDFANARVEFNRALMRQDKAKEYFAKQIESNRKEFDEAKQDANYEQNMGNNYNTISARYEHLLKDFATTQDFVNPYATYMASVFFFLDGDYKRAQDLFKEVAIINKNSAEFNKEFNIFENYAKSLNPQSLQKYVFVVYESGFGAGLDEFAITLPFTFDGNVVTSSLALPTLKKRTNSYEYVVANGSKVADFVDFDNIIATEFKANMGFRVGKALSSTIVKTTMNLAVAKNDPTGGYLSLATSLFNSATTKADLRFWSALPKYAKILALENTGSIVINSDNGTTLYKNEELPQDKNLLIIVKSHTPKASVVWLIQR